jgi:hypothetical protein
LRKIEAYKSGEIDEADVAYSPERLLEELKKEQPLLDESEGKQTARRAQKGARSRKINKG